MDSTTKPVEAGKVSGRYRARSRNPFRRLYDWVLHWSDTRFGAWALAAIAFAESSFFPIPPDVLLIALGISKPRRALWYSLLCSLASVVGGCLGYLIGWQLYDLVGRPIIEFYHAQEHFEAVRQAFSRNAFFLVSLAGFTPIPYKVFTIAAGFSEINFFVFLLASAASRSARFFIVGALLRLFGTRAKTFIDRYFNLLTLAFFALVALGILCFALMNR